MKVDRGFIQQVEARTGLVFKAGLQAENLCYRYNSTGLQTEFKEVFTREDLRLFLASFGKSTIALPPDRESFWNAVEKGRHSIL